MRSSWSLLFAWRCCLRFLTGAPTRVGMVDGGREIMVTAKMAAQERSFQIAIMEPTVTTVVRAHAHGLLKMNALRRHHRRILQTSLMKRASSASAPWATSWPRNILQSAQGLAAR